MRQIRILFMAVVIALLTSACHTEINERISSLKVSVTELENEVVSINSNIASLKEIASALESNDNIVDITEVVKNGKRGYTITFTSGATMDLFQGTDGVTPYVGIKRAEDGEYYWTIQMGENGTVQWMTSSLGIRCRATSTNIKLKNEDGWWWWSLDETNWTAFNKSIGEDGTTMFNGIDTSNKYYVTFTLVNGEKFSIMRAGALEEIKQFCDNAKDEFETYKKLVTELDTTLFIKQISEILGDNNEQIGYSFKLAGDSLGEKSISIYNGKDLSGVISVKIVDDNELGCKYWMYKVGDNEEYNYITVDSVKLKANPTDVVPYIGVLDTLGSFCLIVASNINTNYELLRDKDGNPVRLDNLTSFNWFSNVNIGSEYVTFTNMDSTTFVLPRYNETVVNPSMSLSMVDTTIHYIDSIQVYQYVRPSESDTIKATITNMKSGVKLSAMVLDGSGYVTGIAQDSNVFRVGFKTNSEIGPFVSVALFLNWDNKSIMKVMKFERAEEPLP